MNGILWLVVLFGLLIVARIVEKAIEIAVELYRTWAGPVDGPDPLVKKWRDRGIEKKPPDDDQPQEARYGPGWKMTRARMGNMAAYPPMVKCLDGNVSHIDRIGWFTAEKWWLWTEEDVQALRRDARKRSIHRGETETGYEYSSHSGPSDCANGPNGGPCSMCVRGCDIEGCEKPFTSTFGDAQFCREHRDAIRGKRPVIEDWEVASYAVNLLQQMIEHDGCDLDENGLSIPGTAKWRWRTQEEIDEDLAKGYKRFPLPTPQDINECVELFHQTILMDCTEC